MTGEFDAAGSAEDHPYATWDAAYVLGALSGADRHGGRARLPRRWNDSYGARPGVLRRYPELWRDDGAFDAAAALWRWTIDLGTGTVEQTRLDDRGVEFPRIDERRSGRPGPDAAPGSARFPRQLDHGRSARR